MLIAWANDVSGRNSATTSGQEAEPAEREEQGYTTGTRGRGQKVGSVTVQRRIYANKRQTRARKSILGSPSCNNNHHASTTRPFTYHLDPHPLRHRYLPPRPRASLTTSISPTTTPTNDTINPTSPFIILHIHHPCSPRIPPHVPRPLPRTKHRPFRRRPAPHRAVPPDCGTRGG